MVSKGIAFGGVQGQSPWPSFLLEPLAFLDGTAGFQAVRRGDAVWLAGGPMAFALARLHPGGEIVRVGDVPARWRNALEVVTRPPLPWADLPTDRPAVMGILNATPDSFSDGGEPRDFASLRAADIIDIGGESTRPGSAPVPPDIERVRILPAIAALAGSKISVDTRNATTMAAALDAGAAIVNDVSALRHDPDAAALVAARGCPVILMHMRGEPATMHEFARYDDVALEVLAELAERLAAAEAAGIARERIALDPGIGFGKTAAHNVELLQRLPLLLNLGCRLVVGVSRKRFIGTLGGALEPQRRGPGSLAAALHAVSRGASILRVHDVADTIQALQVWSGIGVHGFTARGEMSYAKQSVLGTTPE